jgi:hypothetical protein
VGKHEKGQILDQVCEVTGGLRAKRNDLGAEQLIQQEISSGLCIGRVRRSLRTSYTFKPSFTPAAAV